MTCCSEELSKELSLSGTLAPGGGSLEYWDLRSSSCGLCMGKAPLAAYKCCVKFLSSIDLGIEKKRLCH